MVGLVLIRDVFVLNPYLFINIGWNLNHAIFVRECQLEHLLLIRSESTERDCLISRSITINSTYIKI